MPSPTFIAAYNSTYSTAATPKTLSVTTQAGDMVVVYGAAESDSTGSNNFSGLSGNGITFTQQLYNQGASTVCEVAMWTGIDTTGGTNWTLSLSYGGSVSFGVSCLVFRNAAGVGGKGSIASSGAPSLSITTTAANSAIVVVSDDWDGSGGPGTRTWRTVNGITPTNGNGLETLSSTTGFHYTYGAYYNDAGTPESKTVGLSAPSGQAYTIAALEIIGSASTAVQRNTAEGQSNGTTLTAANSGGGSGRQFEFVDTSGSPTCTFSNAQKMHGTQSYAINSSSSKYINLVFDGYNASVGSQQAYFYFTGYPSANCSFMAAYTTGFTSLLGVSSTGQVKVFDNNTTLTTSGSGVIPLNTWVRFDMITTIGATASTGRVQVKISSADDTASPLFSYDSGNTASLGTSNITSYVYGKTDSSPSLACLLYTSEAETVMRGRFGASI